MSQLSAECCRLASVAALVVACIDKPAMASEAEKEEWTGGEVLFAGGTDWAKVHMPAYYDAFVDVDAKIQLHSMLLTCRRLHEAEAARNRLIKRRWCVLMRSRDIASRTAEILSRHGIILCISGRRRRLSASSCTQIS